MAGIAIFATGGIGGVHRGAEKSFDISADIIELGKTPVAVVCAGIKSILDIGKTLEMLETQGVPVVGLNAPSFPAFFTNESGFQSPLVARDCQDIATMMLLQRQLPQPTGVVVAVPNPDPAGTEKMQYAIEFALARAESEGVRGAATTPYLLKRVEELSQGESLAANEALIKNNAAHAAKIAVHLAALSRNAAGAEEKEEEKKKKEEKKEEESISQSDPRPQSALLSDPQVTLSEESVPRMAPEESRAVEGSPLSILVVGGAVIDQIGHITVPVHPGSSNPGQVRSSFGGVARNVAASLSSGLGLGIEGVRREGRTGHVFLATAVAADMTGTSLLRHCEQLGIDTSLTRRLPSEGSGPQSFATASYLAIHDRTDLLLGVADMRCLAQLDAHFVKGLAEAVAAASVVVADGNLSSEAFFTLSSICRHFGVPLVFEPTSDHKCLLPFAAKVFHRVALLKPNLSELVQMVTHCLQQSWVSSGSAQVKAILSQLVADRVDGRLLQEMDLTDVRILAHALYQAMLLPEPPSPSPAPTPSPVPSPSALLSGKHLLVSLGRRGVLWCGPATHLLQSRPRDRHRATAEEEGEGAGLVVVEAMSMASWYLSALPVEGELQANGAGDAFLGGLLSEAVKRKSSGEKGGLRLLPDLGCIQQGLLHAHERLISLQEVQNR